MCEVELNPVCPNLSLERTQSSFLLPLEFLPLPTVGCTECRYLPFKPLSQNNCQFVFIPFLIIDLNSALLYRICISIFSFVISCLANWSASSFPANPVWAGTHNKWTILFICCNIYKNRRITKTKSCLVSEFWASMHNKADHTNVLFIPISYILFITIKIASNSPVNPDTWLYIILPPDTFKLGITYATPT